MQSKKKSISIPKPDQFCMKIKTNKDIKKMKMS